MRVATSPGMSRSMANTITLTRIRVGTARATRRRTYCFTASRVAWRRLETADHVGQTAGDVDRRRVLEIRTDDLDAHRQAVAREPDGRGGRGQAGERRERDPGGEVEVRPRPRRRRNRSLEHRAVIMDERGNERGGQQEGIVVPEERL